MAIKVLILIDEEYFDQFVIDPSYDNNSQAEDYFLGRINNSIKAAARELSRPKLPGQHPLEPKVLGDDPRMDRDPSREPLPFDDGPDGPGCWLPGYEDHTHCELHDECIPMGSDCPICMELEANASHEMDAIMDARQMMESDPINQHHPDCQCTRCNIGDDAYLWLYHPEDY